MIKWQNNGRDNTIIYEGDERVAYADEPFASQIIREHNSHAALLEACESAFYLPTVWANDPTGEIAAAVKAEVLEELQAAIELGEGKV